MSKLNVVETVYELEHTDGYTYRFHERKVPTQSVTVRRVRREEGRSPLWSHGVLCQMPMIENGNEVWKPSTVVGQRGTVAFYSVETAMKVLIK